MRTRTKVIGGLAALLVAVPLAAYAAYTVLGGVALANLDSMTVYPNPFCPNDDRADNGVPYQAGNANSGLIFGNLSANVTIEVYDNSGRLAAKLEPHNASRNVQWDTRDDDGDELPGGVYSYMITDANGRQRTGCFAIVR